MSKINFKNIILCLVLIIPLKIATHFFLFKEVSKDYEIIKEEYWLEFELNNKTYTLDILMEAAEERNRDFDEYFNYLKEKGLKTIRPTTKYVYKKTILTYEQLKVAAERNNLEYFEYLKKMYKKGMQRLPDDFKELKYLEESKWEYHNFEAHFNFTFYRKLWIFPLISGLLIFIFWYFNLFVINGKEKIRKSFTKKPLLKEESISKELKKKEILKEYYENGKLNYEAEAIDGIKNGYYKDYYENGALKVETTFKDDKMDGECKFYFESGNLSELSHYTAGEPTVGSIVKRYFENGELQEEVSVSKEGDEFKETVIKNNLDFLKIDVTAFPESTIKDINELDEEKRNQLMDITIFFDKYGYADKTKGRASTIIEGLEFISRLKGIKEDEFVFDIATFLRMGDDYPPTTDKDGKWYVKFGNTLVKYFSEKKFKPALKELLKANNIEEKIVTCECSEDCYCSRKVRIDMRLGVVTQIFVGDGFEICYVIGAYNGKDVSEFIVKNPDVPIFIPKNKDGFRDYKVINFPGESESYAKKLYDVYDEEDSKIINIRNTAEQDKQSLSYIHIEGKGLYSL
jgi:antitoxin component YwqK of YwqJK toxin-antitoxin module